MSYVSRVESTDKDNLDYQTADREYRMYVLQNLHLCNRRERDENRKANAIRTQMYLLES